MRIVSAVRQTQGLLANQQLAARAVSGSARYSAASFDRRSKAQCYPRRASLMYATAEPTSDAVASRSRRMKCTRRRASRRRRCTRLVEATMETCNERPQIRTGSIFPHIAAIENTRVSDACFRIGHPMTSRLIQGQGPRSRAPPCSRSSAKESGRIRPAAIVGWEVSLSISLRAQ